MITIVKGNEKIICSYKTYDEQFRQLGYEPVSDTKKETTKKETPSIEVKVDVVKDAKEKIEKIVEEAKKEIVEEEKIGSKYGVRRRNTSKKEED